jgi:hypothetical protein
LSQELLDQGFSHYFFDGVSKVEISKEKIAEAGTEVNWLFGKFEGKFGGKKGETMEISINNIDNYYKTLLIENYMNERDLITDPIKGDVQNEIFYKYVGQCFIGRDPFGWMGDNSIDGNLQEDVIEAIKNEQTRQETKHKREKHIWILTSRKRTITSILSRANMPSPYDRFQDTFRNLGFFWFV